MHGFHAASLRREAGNRARDLGPVRADPQRAQRHRGADGDGLHFPRLHVECGARLAAPTRRRHGARMRSFVVALSQRSQTPDPHSPRRNRPSPSLPSLRCSSCGSRSPLLSEASRSSSRAPAAHSPSTWASPARSTAAPETSTTAPLTRTNGNFQSRLAGASSSSKPTRRGCSSASTSRRGRGTSASVRCGGDCSGEGVASQRAQGTRLVRHLLSLTRFPLAAVVTALTGCILALLLEIAHRRVTAQLATAAAVESAKTEMENELAVARHVFVSSVSHEIRTPASAIIGALRDVATGLTALPPVCLGAVSSTP